MELTSISIEEGFKGNYVLLHGNNINFYRGGVLSGT
jgi:hypothetical protein